MRAAVYFGQQDMKITEMARPSPARGELLVAVAASGICGTDASEFSAGPTMFPITSPHAVSGHVGPMIPGHEFAGHVIGVGRDVRGFAEGDLVASGAGIACGQCDRCDEGRTNLCRQYSTVGLDRHGGLAEFVAVPAAACTNLANRTLSPDLGAIAQPLSVAVHAMRRAGDVKGRNVLVIGAGGIGSFLAKAAVEAGAHVTVVDTNAQRALSAADLGAHEVHSSTTHDPLEQAQFPVVYECSGSPAGLRSALDHTERGGRVVLVGIQRGLSSIDLKRVVLAEQDLVGTVAHVLRTDFAESLDLLEADPEVWRKVAPLVRPLDQVTAGIESLVSGSPASLKLLYDPRLDVTRELETP